MAYEEILTVNSSIQSKRTTKTTADSSTEVLKDGELLIVRDGTNPPNLRAGDGTTQIKNLKDMVPGVASTSTAGLMSASDKTKLDGIDPVADYIIEKGSSGNWTYRKYASGYADLWWSGTVRPTSYTKIGNMVYTNTFSLTMPFGVSGNVVVTGTCDNLHILCDARCDSDNEVSFRLLRPTALQVGPQGVYLRVVGNW